MKTYKLPIRFYNDRLDRELFDGIEAKHNKAYVWLMLTDAEAAEYKSDALYYAQDCDDAPRGVVSSARATLKAFSI